MGAFQSRRNKSIRDRALQSKKLSSLNLLRGYENSLRNEIWTCPNRMFVSTSTSRIDMWSECSPRYYRILRTQEKDDDHNHLDGKDITIREPPTQQPPANSGWKNFNKKLHFRLKRKITFSSGSGPKSATCDVKEEEGDASVQESGYENKDKSVNRTITSKPDTWDENGNISVPHYPVTSDKNL